MSASFTCFLHPKPGRDFKSLDAKCPECGRSFGWPLIEAPAKAAGATVVEALSRGYYGATYVVESGGLRQKRLLKLVPIASYELFGKDWLKEVEAHNDLANQNQPHFARIFDAGSESVTFGDGTIIKCHWALMDYVPGMTLDRYIKERKPTVGAIAQITLDLLEILRVLAAKQKVHNDLHAGNVIVGELSESDRRAGAIDDRIRAVAIDFGSLAGAAVEGRPTDAQRVGEILDDFTRELLRGNPDKIDSRSYRLASELTRVRDLFGPEIAAARVPDYEELKEAIRTAVRLASGSEWEDVGSLSITAEGYNAQTLKPAAIARLLLDDQKWTDEIAGGGAQIVHGMRGCGKTMLLRSLDFHARVALAAMDGNQNPLEKIRRDGFVGLYVSAARLLDARRNPDIDFRPILFAAFAREAARIVLHLEALRAEVDPLAAKGIADVVQTHLGDLRLPAVPGASSLEQTLQRLLFSLASGEATRPLKTAASTAFGDLARSVMSIAARWGSPSVLFLLDDVSTRYLDDDLIRSVLSEVLFQNELCSFKVTTETQTWVSVLRSPGGIEALREDRDYRLFNLGERVTQRLNDEGWRFIDNLLYRRLRATDRFVALHGVRPSDILGRRTLQDIASSIASTEATATERQSAYSGIDALAAMCVGDIGDTIMLFDRMMEKVKGNVVSAKEQTAAYRQLCGRRLWELASKNVGLKDQALGFAEAAHELLKASRIKEEAGTSRLRQYTKVYVRDIDSEAFSKIRALIDAGVFAIEGGIPRTKTKDADPITHFVLVFRKVLGVNSWIGLSDRDRFELSGEALREWLSNPERSKEVLIRNQDMKLSIEDGSSVPPGAAPEEELKVSSTSTSPPPSAPVQTTIFGQISSAAQSKTKALRVTADLPRLNVEKLERLPTQFDVLFTALGFEQRARVSAERIAQMTQARNVIAFTYDQGLGDLEIARVFDRWDPAILKTSDATKMTFPAAKTALIDITGMKTNVLWNAVHNALREHRCAWISYTRAERYWPSESDIEAVLGSVSDEALVDSRQLSKLRDLVSGDEGKYEIEPLLGTRDDIMRPLCLVAAASPRMRRLEHLVESRAFDRLEILASSGSSPRARLTRTAGNAASVDIASGPLHLAPPTDLQANVKLLEDLYQYTFVDGGMDVALGLTGSKIQSVAMAALSAAVKVAEAWYVQPTMYDPKRFTEGAGETAFFLVSLP